MWEFIKWVVIIIVAFAVLGFLFSKDGEREEGAKIGAVGGISFIASILPAVISIFLIILLVRACA